MRQKLAIEEATPAQFTKAEFDAMIAHASRKNLRIITTVRTLIQQVITATLFNEGFLHPPVHMFSTVTDPLAHATESPAFKYYGQNCSMMQSLIFHKMATVSLTNIDKVFWISPNIRKEMGVSNPKRYATEFTQIDWEARGHNLSKAMHIAEMVVRNVYETLATTMGDEIEEISGRRLEPMMKPMVIIDAEDAATVLGCGLNEVEANLAKTQKHPFFLVNLKREAYDRRDDKGKYQNFDVILPVTGEILSGAERETTYDGLVARMEELGYPLDYFAPILDIAKTHGLKPCAGAGFGVERFTRGILLLDDIADVYTFKRVPEQKIIL